MSRAYHKFLLVSQNITHMFLLKPQRIKEKEKFQMFSSSLLICSFYFLMHLSTPLISCSPLFLKAWNLRNSCLIKIISLTRTLARLFQGGICSIKTLLVQNKAFTQPSGKLSFILNAWESSLETFWLFLEYSSYHFILVSHLLPPWPPEKGNWKIGCRV